MFSSIKDAVYFSKVCGTCMKSFGIDLMPIDKQMNGQLLDASRGYRPNKYSPEQAATLCVAKGLRFLAAKVNAPEGSSFDHRLYARWATIVDGWAAQGLVDASARSQFSDALEFVLMMASKR